jgi:hypothetical protein
MSDSARWGMAVTRYTLYMGLYSYSRYKFITVSILKRLCNGRFASETAVWIQKPEAV